MVKTRKPLIFIGSSTEGIAVARTIEELLYNDASVQIWTADVFVGGTYPLEGLLSMLDRAQFAAFVLTPDDSSVIRSSEHTVPRDNVIFEAGLFMGRLGRLRTFLVYDTEHIIKLPSDLTALTILPYSHLRFIENAKAALGPVANQIRSTLRDTKRFQELHLVKSYIRFIRPDTSLTDTYCRILSHRLDEIRTEISNLEARRDWESLLEVKTRLREYFEYSGSYHQGVECGKAFVRALNEVGPQMKHHGPRSSK